jgi:hypothetical protein
VREAQIGLMRALGEIGAADSNRDERPTAGQGIASQPCSGDCRRSASGRAGAVLFARPDVGGVTLALLFGLSSLVYGVSQMVTGVQLRQTGRTPVGHAERRRP